MTIELPEFTFVLSSQSILFNISSSSDITIHIFTMSVEAKRGVARPTNIKWRELARYQDEAEWEASEENTVVKDDFIRASWVPESVTCTWKCKFVRIKSRIKCKREMKVKFSKLNPEVVLFDNSVEHNHDYRIIGFEDADKDFIKQH